MRICDSCKQGTATIAPYRLILGGDIPHDYNRSHEIDQSFDLCSECLGSLKEKITEAIREEFSGWRLDRRNIGDIAQPPRIRD